MKLGLQILAWVPGALDYVLQARPQHIKTLDANPTALARIRGEIPEAFVVYRRYCDVGTQQGLLGGPVQGAREMASAVMSELGSARQHVDAVEGLNETGLWDAADAYSLFTAEYARILHGEGMASIAYNFSTGTPSGYFAGDGNLEPEAFREGLRAYWAHYLDGLRESDYLGLHEYSAPTMLDSQSWLCLRYRRVWDVLPPDCRKPILITECGIDGGVIGRPVEQSGWRAFCSEEEYLTQLGWYVAEAEKDNGQNARPLVKGIHVYHAGSADPRWGSFSVLGYDRIADDIRNQRSSPIMTDHHFEGDFVRFAAENPRLKLTPTSEAAYLSEDRAVQLANKGALVYVPGERTTLHKPYRPRPKA